MIEQLHTLDFETEAIVGNPLLHPPKPVGLAVTYPDMTSYYHTGQSMVQVCKEIYALKCPLLFHNAPFDLSVAAEHFGLPFPPWELIHDTQYLVYINDPHAASLALKPSAERYLDMPPQEQDDLKAWVLANVPKATEKGWGAYISFAPVELVEPYAKGDTIRTRLLFDHLYPKVPQEPYDRERRLMPITVAATKKGVRVDREGLVHTHDVCAAAQESCRQRICTHLNSPDLNIQSGIQLADALDKADAVDGWELTPKGKRSTARENLVKHITDPVLLNMLAYASTMKTLVGTFIDPWIEKSTQDGRLHPNWNQIRSTEDRTRGTRTGRLSSDDPNFQNIPNVLSCEPPAGLPALPHMRDFVLPELGHVWLKRDWSAQEMRILAHFEDGELLAAYKKNPTLDPHNLVREMILERIHKDFSRRFIKETGFGMIYGMGAPGLANKIGGGMTEGQARELMEAYKLILPGVGVVQAGTKERGRAGLPIKTWGGRPYHAEVPKIINGKYRSFEYKLCNYLIQGSAADQAKQTVIDWDKGKDSAAVFMATVHDEISISSPIDAVHENMQWLAQCMEKDYFDCPMKSDSFMGPSWGKIEVVA